MRGGLLSAYRPVRVVRAGSPGRDRAVRVPVRRGSASPPTRAGPQEIQRLENRSATERAVRLSVLYTVALAIVYGILALYARSAPGGTSSGATAAIALFGGVAVAVGLLGTVVALTSAPARIELATDATVLVGRLGRRRRLPPLTELDVRVVRHYRAGLLSSTPVDQVELTPRAKGRRISFLVQADLLRSTGLAATSTGAPVVGAGRSG